MIRRDNVILVGLMGAGKTTVGRLLARRLRRRFIDSDHEIEASCGVRIPVIFDVEGEAGFRAREARMLATLCQQRGLVLATGGGAVLREANRRKLAESGTVIYLHGLPGELWQRVRRDRNRPLLATSSPRARLEELYAERDPLYREVADIVIETSSQSAPALVRQMIPRLDRTCQACT